MTRNFYWGLLIVGFVLEAGVAAQTRQITEVELDKLQVAAIANRKGIPVRIKMSATSYSSNSTMESLQEWDANGAYHFVYITRENGVETRTETIRIGAARYSRLPDGSWTKQPTGQGSGRGTGTGDGSGGMAPTRVTEYLYLGPDKVNGQDTFHYRKVLTVTYAGTKPLSRRDIDDFWINSDGLMVKEASEGSFGTMDPLYKNVTNYEYPKEIKIVAPIPD